MPKTGTFDAWTEELERIYFAFKTASTRRNFHSHMKKHASPYIGKKYLTEITYDDLSKIKVRMAEKYKPGTINHIFATLSIVFKQAVKHGKIKKSPVDKDLFIKEGEEESILAKILLPKDELYAVVDSVPGIEKYIWALAAFAGARAGEVFGFRWRDFEDNFRLISFLRQIQRGQITSLKGKFLYHHMAVIPHLQEILKEWRAECNHDNPWLFQGYGLKARKYKFYCSSSYIPRFALTRTKLGLPAEYTFHTLRHNFGSILLEDGLMLTRVSEWMRHKNISTTEDYYKHLIKENLQEDLWTFQ